jgi:hypothetical protein
MRNASQQALERTRHKVAFNFSCVGEPLKRNVLLVPLSKSVRKSMRKIALALTVIAWTVLFASIANACTCSLDISLLRKPEEQQVKIARKRAKVVFLGKVVEITDDETSKSYRARIRVLHSWKNISGDEVIVSGTTMCCICEYIFHVGETYLIYASDYDHKRKQYGTSICTRTVPLDQADLDLRVLGKGKLHGVERTTFRR